MDRTKAYLRIQICGLGLLAHIACFAQDMDFKIGAATAVKGKITSLRYSPPHEVKEVKLGQEIVTEGSYLTQDTSHMVVTMFDGTHIRLNPKSKMSFEYDAEKKITTIHLFLGSLKVRFHHEKPHEKSQKLIVKSADTFFETVSGKFSVVRSVISDENSVYVEAGSVVVNQFVKGEKKDSEIVHTKEMTSVKDTTNDIEAPRPMTDKQIEFLNPKAYLK